MQHPKVKITKETDKNLCHRGKVCTSIIGYSIISEFEIVTENAPVQKAENTAWGSVAMTKQHPLSATVGANFADKWPSLGRYSLLAD
jgi:hypothetical protein